jgi:hypothetical protein
MWPLRRQDCRPGIAGADSVADRCFAVSKQRLYYAAIPSLGTGLLHYLDLTTNKAGLLYKFKGRLSPTIVVSPEGDRVLYRQVDREGSNLMLVNDFR